MYLTGLHALSPEACSPTCQIHQLSRDHHGSEWKSQLGPEDSRQSIMSKLSSRLQSYAEKNDVTWLVCSWNITY